jgi:hypothetical protein
VKHRGSRDANHADVVSMFERLGCTVADTAFAGVPNWPDLVVGCVGVNHLVEIKNPDTRYGRAGLNPGQSAFARDWRGGAIEVVESVEDAVTLVMSWRAHVRSAHA